MTPSWNQIQAMNAEEVAKLNKKLVTKLVLFRIVLPAAATAAAIIIMKKLEQNSPLED